MILSLEYRPLGACEPSTGSCSNQEICRSSFLGREK